MRKLLAMGIASLMLIITGCVGSEVEGNRHFWTQVSNENQVGKGAPRSSALAAPDTAASDDATPRVRGYALVASQVLGTPRVNDRSRDGSPRFVSGAQGLRLRQYILHRADAAMAGKGRAPGASVGPLTEDLAKHPMIQGYVKSVVDPTDNSSEKKIRVSASDAISFAREISRIATARTGDEDHAFGIIVRLYWGAYFKGKFVDRRGIKFDAPSFDKGVTGDTLAAFVSIGTEALGDFMFETPCLKKGDKYVNETGEEPTAVTLEIQQAKEVSSTPNEIGVTDLEADLLSYTSSVAGKKSKVVSELVVKLFKDVKVDFVLGGTFAIGDSAAFEKMVTNFIDVASRRLTEHFAYEGLNAFRYTLVAGAGPLGEDAITPVNPTAANQVVALLLQEQQWLKKLLK